MFEGGCLCHMIPLKLGRKKLQSLLNQSIMIPSFLKLSPNLAAVYLSAANHGAMGKVIILKSGFKSLLVQIPRLDSNNESLRKRKHQNNTHFTAWSAWKRFWGRTTKNPDEGNRCAASASESENRSKKESPAMVVRQIPRCLQIEHILTFIQTPHQDAPPNSRSLVFQLSASEGSMDKVDRRPKSCSTYTEKAKSFHPVTSPEHMNEDHSSYSLPKNDLLKKKRKQ